MAEDEAFSCWSVDELGSARELLEFRADVCGTDTEERLWRWLARELSDELGRRNG